MLALYYTRISPPLKVDIDILDIGELLLHEEIVPDLLEKLVEGFKRSHFMFHPIIVDRRSKVVLDGTHRVLALRKLAFKHILACEIEYNHPAILVYRWFRSIDLRGIGRNKFKSIVVEFSKDYNLKVETVEYGVRECRREDVVLVEIPPETIALVKDKGITTREAYSLLKELEKRITRYGLNIEYSVESISPEITKDRYATIIPRRISKEDVVEAAVNRRPFPPKSTRHIIPIRPMFVNIPLRLLKSTLPLDIKRMIAREYLEQKSIVRIKGGIKIDRLYEEEFLYIFI
ncbi:MAG: hypothetical protein DRJ49_04295 [Thermoprotei archaeon]|nr:MAG: hypothetical protein DRJ49_04295 [Thermoprotei archaeon]